MLPFSHEQFVEVFAACNTRIWPAQVLAYALALVMLGALARGASKFAGGRRVMNTFWLRAMAVWLVLLVLAIGNGVLREGVLHPWLGRSASLVASGAILAALVLGVDCAEDGLGHAEAAGRGIGVSGSPSSLDTARTRCDALSSVAEGGSQCF